MKTLLLASLVLAVTSATSFAGTPWINARQNTQANRIVNGFASGRLTNAETAKLVQGQAHESLVIGRVSGRGRGGQRPRKQQPGRTQPGYDASPAVEDGSRIAITAILTTNHLATPAAACSNGSSHST